MGNHSRRRKIKEYANQIWFLLEKGVDRRKVKNLLYKNHGKHASLGIKEETLDIIWESLMEGTFDPKDSIILKTRGEHTGVYKTPRPR